MFPSVTEVASSEGGAVFSYEMLWPNRIHGVPEKAAADLCKKRGGQTRRAASGHLEARAAGRSTSSHKKLEYLGILKLSRCFGESVTAVPVDR